MKQQPDLVPESSLQLKPGAGRAEPRLWVRRLVIWSEPGDKLRDVRLRPGLNIVWSPDPSDRGRAKGDGDGIGHGSGKTLFCRLLRYCLGEDRFAPDDLRDRIASSLKDGLVGAEVVVDGTTWAVVRAIGLSRRHVAVCDGDLDAVASGSGPSTGMSAFIAALESSILSEPVAALIPRDQARTAWLTALAWLARDQECRFDSVLAWRAAASESGSPARNLSDAERIEVIRALLGALTPAEQRLRKEVSHLDSQRNAADRDRTLREWGTSQHLLRLAAALSIAPDTVPPGSLGVDYLRKKARARLASVAVVPSTGIEQGVESLRSAYDAARTRHEALAVKLAALDGAIPELNRLVSVIRSELPTLSFEVHGAEHPACPLCEVPVDRVLADGCKLSHKLPDLEEIRRRRDARQSELKETFERLGTSGRERAKVAGQLVEAEGQAQSLRERLETAERVRDARGHEWFTAQRNVEDVSLLDRLLGDVEAASSAVNDLNELIGKAREQISSLRDSQAKVIRHASKLFDAIVRDLVEKEAEGKITLDGNGLHLRIELGGDRSTAAIDSLKVLAFDLAALCMSIEGRTHIPAFLIHDSPREADLGLSRYHRLFEFLLGLEAVGGRPLFQYIVTTTTRPPANLCQEPWLTLTLEGMPAEKRLLGRDL